MFAHKKIDLHLHFDGSLPLACAKSLAKDHPEYAKMSERDFRATLQVDADCHSLYDYLARFDTTLSLLQDTQGLYLGMMALIEALHQQGLCYAEIRFAPQQHTHQGLSQQEVVKTLLQAQQDAQTRFPDLKIRFILCMMILGEEALTHDANMETLLLCERYLGKGVVALDIAGAEGMAPMQDFASFFTYAKEKGIPFTIHAGESFGPENIRTAISFGACRIGHGATAIQDEEVLRLLKEKQIPLEVCVTSNVNCEVVDSYASHPIRQYIEYGIPVTINTDNMTISNTNLDKEYAHLMKELGLSKEAIAHCLDTSLQYAFLSDAEKKEVLQGLPKESIEF